MAAGLGQVEACLTMLEEIKMQLKLNFLNNWKILWKLLLIPAVMLIPIGFALSKYTGEKSADISFSAKEQLGLEYLAPLKSAHRELARYREWTNAVARGASAAQSFRAEALAAVDKNLAAVEALDQREASGYGRPYGAVLESTSALRALQQKWSQSKNRNTGNAAEVFNENTQMLQSAAEYIRLVTDKSNLTLDP